MERYKYVLIVKDDYDILIQLLIMTANQMRLFFLPLSILINHQMKVE